jgi:opacity protein-like surface antigen
MLSVVACASQATAGGRLGTYVELKGGIYSPSATFNLKNIDLETTFNSATDTGVNGEIAVGHYFLPTLAVEAGIGYFKGKGSFATTPPHRMSFNVVPVLLSAKALIPVGPVDPYGELGIGAYFTRFDVTDNASTFSGSSTLGLHAGAGVNVNVTPVVFVGVEGRYVSANPSFGDQKIKVNDTEYALNGFKLNGFTTTLAVGYSF